MAYPYHPSSCNCFQQIVGLNPYHPPFHIHRDVVSMINACKIPYMDERGYMRLNNEGVRVQLHGIGSGALFVAIERLTTNNLSPIQACFVWYQLPGMHSFQFLAKECLHM